MMSPWDRLVALTWNATEAVIAAPYIKEYSLRRLLEQSTHLAHLTCVTRWRAGDIAAGVSDTAVRDLVKSFGGAFWLHPSLHAKYYRFDEEVLIGSANLTDAGLGIGHVNNLEILARPAAGGFDSVAFEQDLLAGSREIDDGEFVVWDAIPVAKSVAEVGPDSSSSGWYPTTRDPANLWQLYSGHRNLLSVDVRQRAEADLSVLGIPSGLDTDSFRSWVLASLLTSSFVADVRRIGPADEPQAFIQLADDWRLEPRCGSICG